MKNFKEYEVLKKDYIKLHILNSDTIYNYFSNDAILALLRKYYELYTKFLFNSLMGSLKLDVSPEKAKLLVGLKGEGSWEFAGMIDMYEKGKVTCELGHPLRYVYKARNTNNGEILNFGSRCVGDFFDLDSNGVKALTRVKDEMFDELKELVAIREQGLLKEHYLYECGNLGKVILLKGKEGVKKLYQLNSLYPIVYDFVSLNLPLPKSLLNQLLKVDNSLTPVLKDSNFLDINMDGLNILCNSSISLISLMFTHSYQDILDNIQKGNCSNVSDFYNFRNISDLNISISHWLNRNDRILKAQDYFKNQGITLSWLDVYRYMIQNRLYTDNPKLYYGVELLLLFGLDILVESTLYMPKEYTYKGYKLSPKAHDDFDELLTYLASREFLMCIKEVHNGLTNVVEKENLEQQKVQDMFDYLKENLDNSKYDTVKGIDGVRDIILKKCLTSDNMSDRQYSYVSSVYQLMLNLDSKSEEVTSDVSAPDALINNRYTLSEKPEILAKVQRLQRDVENLPTLTSKILNTVMHSRYVSDKQIIHIDKAYNKYILNEDVREDAPIESVKKADNKKWNLIERPDVKDKIIELKRHSEYVNIPSSVKNIFSNILKYNMASDKQIEVVEKTYKRYFGGK